MIHSRHSSLNTTKWREEQSLQTSVISINNDSQGFKSEANDKDVSLRLPTSAVCFTRIDRKWDSDNAFRRY